MAQSIVDTKSGYAVINNGKIYYNLIGSGETIVLIHGNYGDQRYWSDQIQAFYGKYEILIYDIRGYGKSKDGIRNRYYSNVNDLRDLLTTLSIKRTHIIGFSMGSAIALDFALKYPELCISLVLLGPWKNGYSSTSTKELEKDNYLMFTEFRQNGKSAAIEYLLKRSIISQSIHSQETFEKIAMMVEDFNWNTFYEKHWLREENNLVNISKISIPTLIVTSEYDLSSCREISEELSRSIPNSKVVEIKNAGHFMMFDNTKDLNMEVLDFLYSVHEKDK